MLHTDSESYNNTDKHRWNVFFCCLTALLYLHTGSAVESALTMRMVLSSIVSAVKHPQMDLLQLGQKALAGTPNATAVRKITADV